ncbi:MAG TPA: thiamine pyrophosphate-dependent enzyme [Clostridia bacterium]|nr:thiamine pyrophosphate-dependent enzyme [Clostridia bacterium]
MKKMMMTGNEAIARGFYEAGGVLASSYPGSPTVGILSAVNQYDEIYSEFSTNEKVALEVAIGASFNGARAMVAMKHVGLNISLDPLMAFTEIPTQGPFLLVTGDDPGLSSSQNEQDNRNLGKFANMAIVDPSNSQEALEFTKKALDLSSKYNIPMMLRITSRLCHSRSIVTLNDRVEYDIPGMEKKPEKYCMIPSNAKSQQTYMKDRLEAVEAYAYDTSLNIYEPTEDKGVLIITSGLLYENLKELDLDVSIWKLGLIYPISKKRAIEITADYDEVIVIEEMTPFIENELKLMGVVCKGKEYFSLTGELSIEAIEKGLEGAAVINKINQKTIESEPVVARHPVFCTGCPHRSTFDIVKKSKADLVIGDIGCYSLAALPPFEQSNSIISMGASVGITKGLIKSRKNNDKPIVSVIGDGTFFHSGIPSFINLLHQSDGEENVTFLILDNRTTAMTGGQHNGSSGRFNSKNDLKVSIKDLLETIGFEEVEEINQYNYKKAKEKINNAIGKKGISIFVLNGPCALKYKLNKPYYYVDPTVCIGCRNCIHTGCPPLEMKKYHNIDKLKSSIDQDMCVGCSVCAQVCPVNAIKLSTELEVEDE